MPKVKRIKLTLFDIDGCLFHQHPRGQVAGAVEKWLIHSNLMLLMHEQKRIRSHRFHKVIIAYGTNRQDQGCNIANSHRGGSLSPVLPLMQSYFDCCTGAEVVFDPFMMADLFGQDHQAGHAYQAILREEHFGSRERHSRWVFDSTKISLIYAHAHRVASLHPVKSKIVIDLYEDRKNIIRNIQAFYSRYPECLPNNVELNIHQYNGKKLILTSSLKGSGEIDDKYDWSVRYLSLRHGFFKLSKQLPAMPANAEELRDFHEKDQYQTPQDYLETCPAADEFDLQAFLDFRATELRELESNQNLVQEAYSKAIKLFETGLIPIELVYQNRFRPGVREEYSEHELGIVQDIVQEEKKEKTCCCFPSFFKKKRREAESEIVDVALELQESKASKIYP